MPAFPNGPLWIWSWWLLITHSPQLCRLASPARRLRDSETYAIAAIALKEFKSCVVARRATLLCYWPRHSRRHLGEGQNPCHATVDRRPRLVGRVREDRIRTFPKPCPLQRLRKFVKEVPFGRGHATCPTGYSYQVFKTKVDASSQRDLREASVYSSFMLPKLYMKMLYCPRLSHRVTG